jgi:hypothetical protein
LVSWFGDGSGGKNQPVNELVRLEKFRLAHRLSSDCEVLEGEVADAGVGLAPEDLGFTQNTGRGDPLPPNWIGRTLIGTLLGLGGVAGWVFCFQERLRKRQVSLLALLLLLPAAIVPIKIGFWLLSDTFLFWDY